MLRKRYKIIKLQQAGEQAKTLINSELEIAKAKILEAKNLALLNGEKPEDLAEIEAEANLHLTALNLTAQEQTIIVEQALNDSIAEVTANDDGKRFAIKDADGSLNLSSGNITTTRTGFFGFLGSLTSRITKLFVQDIDVSGNITGVTKEVFFQIDSTDASFGDFRTKSLSSGKALKTNFQVPSDFSSLVSLEIILVPTGTNAAAPIDLYSDYGTIGEAYNQHSESLSTTWNLGTANNFYAEDISGVFTNLNAGDFGGVQLDEGAFGFVTHYLGIRLKYKT